MTFHVLISKVFFHMPSIATMMTMMTMMMMSRWREDNIDISPKYSHMVEDIAIRVLVGDMVLRAKLCSVTWLLVVHRP